MILQIGRVINGSAFVVREGCWSSRPRELPPQSLTDTDMNLSVHPAPIDQPTVPQIASAQTNEASV